MIAARGGAYDRMHRVMILALAIGTILLVALNVREVVERSASVPIWWAGGVLAGNVVPAVVCMAVVRRASSRVLRMICAVQAGSYLAALALLPFVYERVADPSPNAPWIFNITVLGATAAAGAFRPRTAWIYMAVLTALMFLVTVPLWVSTGVVKPVLDALFDAFYQTFCFAIALATLRAGRILEQRADAAVDQARATAATSARALEDARLHALLHDHVLSALLVFARGDGDGTNATATARLALDALETANEARDAGDLDQRALVWSLQSVTTEVVPDALFRVEGSPSKDVIVPAEVASALREATREVLRNSVLHAGVIAGSRVARVVRVRLSPNRIAVQVVDDGCGFDPSQVAESRLGLRVSVVGRLDGVEGGSALVHSQRGTGTFVELTWSRP